MKNCYSLSSIVLFSALLLAFTNGYAQSNNCPDNAAHPQNDSQQTLEYYLNSDSFESVQPVFNLPDLQDAAIERLTGNSNPCFELNSFKSQNFVNVESNERFTYYKVSNYYFIVNWYSVNTTGYINIIILDNQYNLLHEALL